MANRLMEVLKEIRTAEKKAGRGEGTVNLVVVSKTQPIDRIREIWEAGHKDFGENRVQELVEKQAILPDARWHLIGTLQRNKVKYIAPFIHLIHSVDSADLLAEINRQGGKNNRILDCLLQINISKEEQKSGMEPEEAEKILREISLFPHVRILGMMGMAELTEDRDRIRAQFRSLRLTFEKLRIYEGEQVQLRELSMGMSGDYDIAIEEGATLVRIGTAVFGARN